HADAGSGMEMRSVSDYQAHKIPVTRGLGTLAHKVEQLAPDTEVLRRLQEKLPKGATAALFLDRPVPPIAADTVSDQDTVKLVDTTSNRFAFDVSAGRDGYFVFGQPMLKGFVATVDGAPVEIATANALFPAVFVPRGAHHVVFRFISKPFFAGAAIWFVTLWVWIAVSIRRRRWLLPIFAVLSAAALAGLLYASVFKGPSFGTIYSWQAKLEPPSSAP
ncbi:MAG: YfhO family protein, partial [Byssovorax sp.]